MTELERIFHEALERPEQERGAFVELACGEDRALAGDVASLLRQHQQETAELAASIETVASDLFTARAAAGEIGPGAMLGPYRIDRKVGQGGMGTVYAAVDTRLGRQVAIKMLRHTFGDQAEALARFHREARSAAALAHVNIAVLHDSGESDGAPFLVMEFVAGEPLRSRLGAGPLGEATVARYAAQLAGALEHAHLRGIVHRDIKPENILLAEDGNLKVIDFGIARILHDAGEAATGGPYFLGTPAYAAPELLAGGAETECSDVYSFGVVVYEMACGAPPFQRRQDAYIPAGVRNPALPAALAAFIDRCLAPDPADRYRNGARLAEALRRAANDTGRSAPDSVAIIAFSNLSGDAAQDWLGTGIAETLASRLAKLRSVRVTSRARVGQAVERYGNGAVDTTAIGRELSARWVVSGSYQHAGGRVRVTPHLVDALTGDILGTDAVDGRWEEIFEIQDRVANSLVRVLADQMEGANPSISEAPETSNLMAFEQYTRGRQQMYQMRAGALGTAIQHFEQAVALDPGYALAYSALGTSCMLQFLRTSNPDDVKRAGGYLERATALDPELGEPYPWLCNLRVRKNDPAGAFAAGRKGVELQPDLPEAHYFLGGFAYLAAESRLVELSDGATALAEAIRLQPRFHPAWLLLGATAALGGWHEAAVRILSEAVRMESEPDLLYRFVGARTLRATAWMRSGNWARAREGFEDAAEALRAEPEHLYRDCFLALSVCGLGDIALRAGDDPGALAHYRQAWRLVKETPRIVGSARLLVRASAGLAAAYAGTGDRDRAHELARDAAGQLAAVTGQTATVTFESSLAQLHLLLTVTMLRLGDEAAAAGHMERARELGWRDLPWLLADPELRPLHGHAVYLSTIDGLRAAAGFDVPIPSSIRA